jgi:NAD(P)-dependent dehydrogenase (short-subunit alcohol dehydrogenase family)
VLAGRCYDVILNGFGRPEEIQSCLEECKKLGAKFVDHHEADLSDPSQIEACFKHVEDKCGRGPDVLVNNAGELD